MWWVSNCTGRGERVHTAAMIVRQVTKATCVRDAFAQAASIGITSIGSLTEQIWSH